MPPYVSNSNPFPGESLVSNVIHVFGNGFQYMRLPPVVRLLPSGKEAVIYWEYSYEIQRPPEGMVGGAMPGEMKIWIEGFEDQEECLLELENFRAKYKISGGLPMEPLPEKASYR